MDENFQSETDVLRFDVEPDYRMYLMNYPVRVYFAYPLTGLTNEQRQLSSEMRQAARIALEESSVHCFDVYDPSEVTQPGSPHEPFEVYCIDHQRVEASDVVFFFVFGPSTGMGMEAQIAAEATVPRVVISPKGFEITRMFLGAPSRKLAEIRFERPIEITQALRTQVDEIGSAASESRRRRDQANKHAFKNIGRRILKRRILRGITLQQLADQTDQTPEWLQRLEGNPAAARPMSFPLFLRMSSVLAIEAEFDDDLEGLSAKILDKELSPTMRSSLDSLRMSRG